MRKGIGIKENITIRWYENGGWETYSLNLNKEDTYSCVTLDGAKIELTRDIGTNPEVQEFVNFSLEVTPNSDGYITGLQLLLPIKDSLKCSWKPHLCPADEMVIGDKVFRSPVMIFEDNLNTMAILPSTSKMKENRVIPYIMDYVLDGHFLMMGLSKYKTTGHVYFELDPTPTMTNESISISFSIAQWAKNFNQKQRDFRNVEKLLWEESADRRLVDFDIGKFSIGNLEPYVQHGYNWAFKNWKSVCWQEFCLDEKEVGGVVFIVTAKQKPGLGNEEKWREPKSIWNQAWFCSLRSAYGYWQWGNKWKQDELKEMAEKVLEFTLSAPQQNGLFPSVFQAGKDNKWDTGFWMNSSDRRPNGHEDYVHLLDSSWTSIWLLKWYRDIDKDPRILEYVHNYVNQLMSLQLPDGNFPSWVRLGDFDNSKFLLESAETAIHVMLLCLLNEVEPNKSYLEAAKKAGRFIEKYILPTGRWEDFETYWSCSKEWDYKKYGVRDKRSGLYNQCSFGIYWTAEAFKELYRSTGNDEYLELGEQALAELSLYQQIWEPPFFDIPTLGGFGVMNSDDEWNDARQSLFALTYIDYYKLTNDLRYLKRGVWALKASFYMMYCPENPEVKSLYEKAFPHFDEKDFGFTMENYNHHDGTFQKGIGEFTIFDWGNGAACSSLAEFDQKISRAPFLKTII